MTDTTKDGLNQGAMFEELLTYTMMNAFTQIELLKRCIRLQLLLEKQEFSDATVNEEISTIIQVCADSVNRVKAELIAKHTKAS